MKEWKKPFRHQPLLLLLPYYTSLLNVLTRYSFFLKIRNSTMRLSSGLATVSLRGSCDYILIGIAEDVQLSKSIALNILGIMENLDNNER